MNQLRYLVVTYIQPKGSTSHTEHATVATRIKPKELSEASVIMDFKTQTIVKCSLGGVPVPKEWQRIRNFFYEHYRNYIDVLERAYPVAADGEKDHV